MTDEREVEAVARAISLADKNDPLHPEGSGCPECDPIWKDARAAIAALDLHRAKVGPTVEPAPGAEERTEGARLIAAERQRQIAGEGWTAEHDDAHDPGELAIAARCYASAAVTALVTDRAETETPLEWPWGHADWKPSVEPIRMLVKSGALIAAEIDRTLRSDAPTAAPARERDGGEQPVVPGMPLACDHEWHRFDHPIYVCLKCLANQSDLSPSPASSPVAAQGNASGQIDRIPRSGRDSPSVETGGGGQDICHGCGDTGDDLVESCTCLPIVAPPPSEAGGERDIVDELRRLTVKYSIAAEASDALAAKRGADEIERLRGELEEAKSACMGAHREIGIRNRDRDASLAAAKAARAEADAASKVVEAALTWEQNIPAIMPASLESQQNNSRRTEALIRAVRDYRVALPTPDAGGSDAT